MPISFLPCFLLLAFFFSGKNAKAITVAGLQGGWTTRGLAPGPGCDGEMSEEHAAPSVEIEDWQISGDTISVFRYPCEFFRATPFSLRGDSLYFGASKPAACRAEMEKGFLKLTWRDCRQQYFKRDTFDLPMLEKLRRDSVNCDCLAGTFQLVTHFEPLDAEPFDAEFPVRMPKHLLVSKMLAQKMCTQKQVTLEIAGTKKLFYVMHVSWDNLLGGYPEKGSDNWRGQCVFFLSPAEWWKGEEFRARYKMISK